VASVLEEAKAQEALFPELFPRNLPITPHSTLRDDPPSVTNYGTTHVTGGVLPRHPFHSCAVDKWNRVDQRRSFVRGIPRARA